MNSSTSRYCRGLTKRIASLFVVVTCALFLHPGVAHARQNALKRPIIGAPVFVTPGGGFEAFAAFKGKVYLLAAELTNAKESGANVEIDLGKMGVEGKSAFEITMPENAAPGFYGLCVTYLYDDERRTDCRPNSVSVISEYKKEFRFAIFSDYHCGDGRGLKNNPGITLKELRAKGIDALKAQKPDFVLMTGDITSYPTSYREDYKLALKEITEGFDFPVFIVPGNHDLYSMGKIFKPPIDGKKVWAKTFGPLRVAFTYGDYRFIGFNSYSWPIKYRDRMEPELISDIGSSSAGVIGEREYKWIEKELKRARDNGSKPVVFAHHGPRAFSEFEGDEKFDSVPRAVFETLLNENGVHYYFYGHVHNNGVREENGMKLIATSTVSSSIDEGDAWSFRTVDVKPNEPFDMKVIEFWRPQTKD